MNRFRSDETGQSLVLIAIMMSVIFGVAALAVDAASWMQRHHQAQVVADSAALAAANCLANPGTASGSIELNGSSQPLPACSNGTDTTDASTVAQDYAKANGLTITTPSSQITFDTSTDHVTVSATATSPGFFSNLFGIHSTTQTAGSQAKWTTASNSSCSSAGSSCAAVFAMGSSCSNTGSQPGGSPIIFSGSGDTLNGLVHSNGSIYEAGGGSQTLGPTTFGNGSGCEVDTDHESGDTWNGSSTIPTTGEAPITTWPEDYTTVVTACGGGLTYACTGPGGTPSYCTKAAANFTFGSGQTTPISGQVWCATGTGTASTPSTWNGLFDFQSSATTLTGNWIGGTVDLDENGWTLSPQLTSFPLLYATGSGNCSSGTNGGVCMTGGSQTVNGSIFAPNGWIEFNGGSSTTTNFLEAQTIYFNGGSNHIIGSGPTSLSGGGVTAGADSLTQ
jgi:Flp pilus assembly protein TadG